MSDKDTISGFIPTFENGGYWEYYKDLERQFENFLEYVPYLSGNEKTYSFRLANLLLATGAHIDCAFKEIAKYPEFSTKYPEIANKSKPTIADYYPLALEYALSQRKVMFKRLPEQEQITPFQQYIKTEEKIETPTWWKVHNQVKHHFSENFDKANLQNVRDALAGAFLLNVIHTPSYVWLMECRVITPRIKSKAIGVNAFMISKDWISKFKAKGASAKKYGVIETSLFYYEYYQMNSEALGFRLS